MEKLKSIIMHTGLCMALVCMLCLTACQGKYKYETVDGDPMKARIYTLDNGLKVYLTVNKNEPRIQTYIAVKTGSKNDPAETTGLAHYLEHLMFKGTSSFGTQDFEKEKPLLDSIRNLYEVYRTKTDPTERAAIYHRIDSISGEASKFAIANEYDKLMASIGADGTNAHTSEDETVYQENIPANEVENWAIVQSDRFKDMVIRGFHTELEAVYEEYNRGLTNDYWKIFEQMHKMLFPHHPYGQQTTIGTQEHLKNPSIINIENYFRKYYVPNNMAICMSGDLDFDKTIAIIDQYFGDMEPGDDISPRSFEPEPEMKEVSSADVWGLEQEMVVLGWRMPGLNDAESDKSEILNSLLYNGKSGLIDVDLVQQQKVLAVMSFPEGMTDYSAFLLIGLPKEGQTLDQVKDLLLAEIEKLKKGEFDESLFEGILNNKKLDDMHMLEDNAMRASRFYSAFIHGRDWADYAKETERISKLTKADIVAYANKYLSSDAYALIYKRQGPDTNEKKIDKPAISPIEMNRDKTSKFVADLISRPVDPIQPVFVDFSKDMSIDHFDNGNELLYKENTQNGTFSLRFIVQRGSKQDHLLSEASAYSDYLGTSQMSAEQIKAELYRLACNIGISVNNYETTIYVNGLAENQEAAFKLLEDWLADMQPDEEKLQELVSDVLTERTMAKSNENNCQNRLMYYSIFGPVNPVTDITPAEELMAAQPQQMIDCLKRLADYPASVRYYGPSSLKDIKALVEKYHKSTPKTPFRTDYPTKEEAYVGMPVEANEVFIAPYESKAVKLIMYSDNGQLYDPALEPSVMLFNEYFGGSMNAIVFQELREARGLAYSAGANYATASHKWENNTFYTQIGSQNDKLPDCLDVFHEIIEHMPVAQNSFDLAKDALVKRLATQRYIGDAVLGYYSSCRRLGLDHDLAADIYAKVKDMTLDDLVQFSKQNVAGRTYKYIVLGDEANLDMKKLESLGPIHRLTIDQIFGY